MNKPTIGLREKKENDSVIHPKQCPKCKSKDIMGKGLVIGYGWINLDDMNVDEADDFEIYDEENLEYYCREDSCGFSWEIKIAKKIDLHFGSLLKKNIYYF